MIVPTIHLNGSGRESLQEQLIEQHQALRAAVDVMERNGPNGRDYYPQGQAALGTATREHVDRMSRVRKVMDEIMEIWQAIEDLP